MQYTNEIFAFKVWTKAQFILLYIDELLPQKYQRHQKYQQGKEDSWDAFRKAKYHKEGYQNKELNLHFHQYCICEKLEELICNKIAG
jgi:hypothetical protein